MPEMKEEIYQEEIMSFQIVSMLFYISEFGYALDYPCMGCLTENGADDKKIISRTPLWK
jgi:hypothetical protein